jgi:hypothetical protein
MNPKCTGSCLKVALLIAGSFTLVQTLLWLSPGALGPLPIATNVRLPLDIAGLITSKTADNLTTSPLPLIASNSAINLTTSPLPARHAAVAGPEMGLADSAVSGLAVAGGKGADKGLELGGAMSKDGPDDPPLAPETPGDGGREREARIACLQKGRGHLLFYHMRKAGGTTVGQWPT